MKLKTLAQGSHHQRQTCNKLNAVQHVIWRPDVMFYNARHL